MQQIRAAVCHQFGEPLSVETVLLAEPGDGEICVALEACAICHSDLMYMDGHWGGELPAVYGHEASGIVESIGPNVSGIECGDHVVVTLIRSCGQCHYCARDEDVLCESTHALDVRSPLSAADKTEIQHGLRTGAFAEKAVVDASQVCVIPADVDFDVASLLACGALTGLGAVRNTAKVTRGSSVIVVGCGGVGLNVVQGASLAGAATIVAVDTARDKLGVARSFGATHALPAGSAGLQEQIIELTAGRGADYVFVSVGSKSALDRSQRYLAPGGALVVVGMPASGVTAEYDPGDLAARGQRILGSKMGSSRIHTDIPLLLDLYRGGDLRLDELISGRFPLQDINAAVAEVRDGNTLRNVIIFE